MGRCARVLLDNANALFEEVAEDSDTVLLWDVHDLNARRILGSANTKTCWNDDANDERLPVRCRCVASVLRGVELAGSVADRKTENSLEVNAVNYIWR